MRSFKHYVNKRDLQENAGLMHATQQGDRLGFLAYLDSLEEEGREVPEILSQWRNMKITNPRLRWMIRRDLPEILMIEKLGTARPWDENMIISTLRERNMIGNVIEFPAQHNLVIAGYSIYELQPDHFVLDRLVIHPMARRHGLGKRFIDKLKDKLNIARRTRIIVRNVTNETVGFFNKMGFKPVENAPNTYEFVLPEGNV